jgi:hypothetical protein
MSSPIQTAKDKDRDSLLMYAPSWAREKRSVVAAHESTIKQPAQGRTIDATGPTFGADPAVEDLRRRRSLTPEIVPEPKFLKGDRPRALIALCVSGVTAIAALIALVVVSLPVMHQRPGNNNIHTALLPNQADVQRDQSPTATTQPSLNERRTQANEPPPNGDNIHNALLPNQADVQRDQSPTATTQPSLNERRTQANEPPPNGDNIHNALLPNQADVQRDQSPTATTQPSLNERRTQANEPPPNGGSEERQGVATVMAGPVADASMPGTASSPTVSQLKTTTAQPNNEEIFALIKLSQDFVRNRDFSSARLLLRRAAEAGSADAALSLGKTFDPLVIQQLHVIGVQPDPAKAREWYERAVQLGSDAASQHLAKLAQSPQ